MVMRHLATKTVAARFYRHRAEVTRQLVEWKAHLKIRWCFRGFLAKLGPDKAFRETQWLRHALGF